MGVIVPADSRSDDSQALDLDAGRQHAVKIWLDSYGSTNTQDAYRRDIGYWFGWCDDNDIDPAEAMRADVDQYARSLDVETPNPSPATKARRLSAVSAFYRYWLYEGFIAHNPVAHVRRPKVSPEPGSISLTEQQMRDYLDYIERTGDLRSAVIVRVLGELGIRVSELCNATITDLSYTGGHHILSFVRKGNVRASLPLAPRTSSIIDAYLDGRDEGWLVQTSNGTSLERQYVRLLLRRLGREAGLPAEVWTRLHPHVLRHTVATLLSGKGRTIQEVQRMLGHADPRTTQRYIDYQENLDSSPVYDLAALYAS